MKLEINVVDKVIDNTHRTNFDTSDREPALFFLLYGFQRYNCAYKIESLLADGEISIWWKYYKSSKNTVIVSPWFLNETDKCRRSEKTRREGYDDYEKSLLNNTGMSVRELKN